MNLFYTEHYYKSKQCWSTIPSISTKYMLLDVNKPAISHVNYYRATYIDQFNYEV